MRNKQAPQIKNNKSHKQLVISPRQSGALVASTLIGVGVLTLPRVTASVAHEAAWMTTIIGSVIAAAVLYIITKLGYRFPKLDIATYAYKILGPKNEKYRWIGRMLSAPFIFILIGYWVISIAMVARTFGEVVVTAVLLQTPLEVIIGSMLLTAFFLVIYDVEVLARVNEVLLPIIALPVLIIAFSSFQSFQLENLLPLWPGLDMFSFMRGVLLTLFAFQGYEIIMTFSAHTQLSRKTKMYNVGGLLFAGFVYTLITVAGVSVFGREELAQLMWPTLELVKVTQVPGYVLERLEGAFLGVWVAAVFTTTANVFYAAALTTRQFFGLKKHRWIAAAFLPIIFWLSLRPQNVHALFQWQEYTGYVGFAIVLIVPISLAIIAKIRKLGYEKPPFEDEKDSQNQYNQQGSQQHE